MALIHGSWLLPGFFHRLFQSVDLLYPQGLVLVLPLRKIKILREHKLTPMLVAAHMVTPSISHVVQELFILVGKDGDQVRFWTVQLLYLYDIGVIVFYACLLIED